MFGPLVLHRVDGQLIGYLLRRDGTRHLYTWAMIVSSFCIHMVLEPQAGWVLLKSLELKFVRTKNRSNKINEVLVCIEGAAPFSFWPVWIRSIFVYNIFESFSRDTGFHGS